MQEMGLGAKIVAGMFIILGVFTCIYEIGFHTVPEGMVLRVWYQKVAFALIMIWKIALVALTIWLSTRVFGVVEARAARYIGRLGVWISCMILVLFLGLVWIIKLFGMDSEVVNDNGTITVAHSDFWEETEYSLWEKESFLYRRYLRESVSCEDVNPDQTREEFLRERYPQLYDNKNDGQAKPTEGAAPASKEAAPVGDLTGSKDSAVMEDSVVTEDKVETEDHVDYQYVANKQNDGLVAIYEVISKEKTDNGYRFETSFSSHGEPQAVIYEDGQVVRFLRYDRVSKNQLCYLYVYYESAKNADGSYSPTEARILDMYAYVVDTGHVVSSGKKAWADLGNTEYREVTGE